jgi:hypothetical protein
MNNYNISDYLLSKLLAIKQDLGNLSYSIIQVISLVFKLY